MSTSNRKYKDSVFVDLFSEDEKAKEDYPETTTLKLSDAFMTKPDSYPLELTVKVFNINTNICIEKGILKEYLMRKSREVINMLVAEYDYDTDIAVQRDEASRIAFAEGIEQGIEQGIRRGFEDGSYKKALETAKSLTERGFAVEAIAKAAGLSIEEIEKL